MPWSNSAFLWQVEIEVMCAWPQQEAERMDNEWIDSVYSVTLHVRYRALSGGYVRDWPPRKIRAVLKEIVQGISPCLNSEDMECRTCPCKNDCCFFDLMVEEPHKAYLPYFVGMAQEGDWRGRIVPGAIYEYALTLIGEKTGRMKDVLRGLNSKRLFAIDGIDHSRVAFEFLGVHKINRGRAITVRELLLPYVKRAKGGMPNVHNVTLELVSPFSITHHNRTLTDPKEMSFEVLLHALHKRVAGLAQDHCGYKGSIPERTEFVALGGQVKTEIHEGFRFVNAKATRRKRGGRIVEEYIGGFTGKISFSGDIGPFFPLIALGEALHIGNDTTQGLGQYRIRLNDSSQRKLDNSARVDY